MTELGACLALASSIGHKMRKPRLNLSDPFTNSNNYILINVNVNANALVLPVGLDMALCVFENSIVYKKIKRILHTLHSSFLTG
jgi:hypothetical protein